jgi:hypothetical protein
LELSSDTEDTNQLEEWKNARDVLKSFDDYLHDLRKYGFTFVTALLTAESILIPTTLLSPDKTVPDPIKFAVFGVTLLLIVALGLIDKNYLVFQDAAGSRALILERKLNLELTEVIADRYATGHVRQNVFLVYLLFTVSVSILGGFVLYPNLIYIIPLEALAIIAIVLTRRLGLHYKYNYKEDWTISPLECKKGSTVKITLTNLNLARTQLNDIDFKELKSEISDRDFWGLRVHQPIIFQKDEIIWVIENQDSRHKEPRKADHTLKIYDSHTWLWETGNVEKGVYMLRPRGWPLPLHRRIIVS